MQKSIVFRHTAIRVEKLHLADSIPVLCAAYVRYDVYPTLSKQVFWYKATNMYKEHSLRHNTILSLHEHKPIER
jgi:hypothetical protein